MPARVRGATGRFITWLSPASLGDHIIATWRRSSSNMAESRLNFSSVATAAAVMTVIGALDGLVDELITPVALRAGWKTLLGAAGLYLNVTNFLSPSSR